MATEKFHYTTEGGAEVVLPKYKNLKAGLIRSIRKLSPVDQIFTAVEAVADEATLAIIDDLGQEECNALIEAWQKDSGVTAGESKASSGS